MQFNLVSSSLQEANEKKSCNIFFFFFLNFKVNLQFLKWFCFVDDFSYQPESRSL